MRISLENYRDYTRKAPLYENGLIFVQSGVEKKDIDCLKMWLRRLCADKNGLSFRLVVSTHESKGNIKKIKLQTGKAGRPKTVVKGKKVEKHCHGLIINESLDNDMTEVKKDLQEYCKKRCKKRPNLKRQKTQEVWRGNLSIVKYMDRQANEIHDYGSFDFDYFLSPYYMPLEPNNFDNILDFDE